MAGESVSYMVGTYKSEKSCFGERNIFFSQLLSASCWRLKSRSVSKPRFLLQRAPLGVVEGLWVHLSHFLLLDTFCLVCVVEAPENILNLLLCVSEFWNGQCVPCMSMSTTLSQGPGEAPPFSHTITSEKECRETVVLPAYSLIFCC